MFANLFVLCTFWRVLFFSLSLFCSNATPPVFTDLQGKIAKASPKSRRVTSHAHFHTSSSHLVVYHIATKGKERLCLLRIEVNQIKKTTTGHCLFHKQCISYGKMSSVVMAP